MGDRPNILLIATRDTKETESRYIRQCLEEAGARVYHLDPSVRAVVGDSEITPLQVAAAAGQTIEQVRELRHEGKCLEVMIRGALACARELDQRVGLNGIIALGGSLGTSLATMVMKGFPYGLPKVMISTMASGLARPFVGAKDIVMFNPVCDIAGLNSITRGVFRGAAIAVVAMGRDYAPDAVQERPLVTMTTLSVTDKCSVRVRRSLEERGFEVMVFHTLGTGGAAMDEIVRERDVAVVLDLSLVEVSEHLHGGLCSAGPDRSKAALLKGVPTIFVPGNLDFLVAGPLELAKAQFPGRRYHVHNPALTAVRAGAEEFRRDAEYLAGLARTATGPVCFFVPLKGFSNHDSPDGYLHDPTLPPVFAEHLQRALPAGVAVHVMPLHINDAEFADALIAQVLDYARAPQPA